MVVGTNGRSSANATSIRTVAPPLLDVTDLEVVFGGDTGPVGAVNGISFQMEQGSTLGLVGESGCGKSATALAIMRLHDSQRTAVEGKIAFDGRDLLGLSEAAMRTVRGNEMAMVFQEPMTSLDPVYMIGDQLMESTLAHARIPRREAAVRAAQALGRVGINSPERRMRQYPHELSGGMQQRVMIAMALSCRPRLIIADEPTTALDVTVQAQILDLLSDVQRETKAALLLITHDLGVVSETCQEVAVMYAGRIVESGSVRDILRDPQHPYTQGLVASSPARAVRGLPLPVIPGSVPEHREVPGCAFAPRCIHAFDRCRVERPALDSVGSRSVACHLVHTLASMPDTSPESGSA